MASPLCPICNTTIHVTSQRLSVDDLFALWLPIMRFPAAIIEDHRKQATETILYRCPNCELGIFLPQIIGTSAFYEAFGHETEETTYERSGRWEFDFAINDLGTVEQVIEVGCGTGNFLQQVQKIAKTTIGLEYNKHALAAARAKGLTVYDLSEQEQIEMMRGQFDAVCSFQVLEHVPEPVTFVRDCASWVKPGGSIVLAVPNSDGIMKHYREDFYNVPPHHATRWTPKTLQTLTDQLGYKVATFAHQPLEANHYDYLVHWWHDVFDGDNIAEKSIRWLGTRLTRHLIQMLRKMGVRHLPMRGHTLYIRMIKSD